MIEKMKEWENMDEAEKTREAIKWICSRDFIEHIAKLQDNLDEIGNQQAEQVLKEISKTAYLIRDEDTGLTSLDVLKVAFFRALVGLYKGQVDFEKTGR